MASISLYIWHSCPVDAYPAMSPARQATARSGPLPSGSGSGTAEAGIWACPSAEGMVWSAGRGFGVDGDHRFGPGLSAAVPDFRPNRATRWGIRSARSDHHDRRSRVSQLGDGESPLGPSVERTMLRLRHHFEIAGFSRTRSPRRRSGVPSRRIAIVSSALQRRSSEICLARAVLEGVFDLLAGRAASLYIEEFPPPADSTVDRPICAGRTLTGRREGMADPRNRRSRAVVCSRRRRAGGGICPGRYGRLPGGPPPSSRQGRRTGSGRNGPGRSVRSVVRERSRGIRSSFRRT